MKKSVSATLTVLLFLVWILPLGAFIRPDQEDRACHGRRAICLCTHLLAKRAAATVAMTVLTNTGPGGPGQQDPAAASPSFLDVDRPAAFRSAGRRIPWTEHFRSGSPVILPNEPVPKA